jgi:hypothetical protein
MLPAATKGKKKRKEREGAADPACPGGRETTSLYFYLFALFRDFAIPIVLGVL